jgi:hypothetical protein
LFQADAGLQRSLSVIMDNRRQRQVIAGNDEARRNRPDEKRLAGHQVSAGLAGQAVRRQPAHVCLPGGQVIRQGQRDLGRPGDVGLDGAIPISRIREIGANWHGRLRLAAPASSPPHRRVEVPRAVFRQRITGLHA